MYQPSQALFETSELISPWARSFESRRCHYTDKIAIRGVFIRLPFLDRFTSMVAHTGFATRCPEQWFYVQTRTFVLVGPKPF